MTKRKRKTAAQREQEQRDALLQRITDIYSGACGDDRSVHEDDCYTGAPELARVIPAVRWVFGEPHKNWWGWKAHTLDRWVTPHSATEHLFDCGFRADEVWADPEGDS